MPTPSYTVNTPPLNPDPLLGQIVSLANRDFRYCAFEAIAGEDLPSGCFVTIASDLTGNEMLRPTATGAKIFGVSIYKPTLSYSADNTWYYYPTGSDVSIIEKGDIVMYSETAAAIGDPVYFRHTANGGLDRIGAIANATGTGLDAVTWATYLDAATAPGLVRVSIRK